MLFPSHHYAIIAPEAIILAHKSSAAFAAGELAIDTAVSNGANDFPVAVPGGLNAAVAYRARLYDSASAPTVGALGSAAGGEVEDGLSPVPWAAPGAVTDIVIATIGGNQVQVT